MTFDWEPYALRLVKKWEGFRSKPYQDRGGKWTIGYGTTVYPGGVPVGPGDAEITEADAEVFARKHLTNDYGNLIALVKVYLAPCQWGAVLDFCYEEGWHAFAGSTLLARINAQDAQASVHFLEWDKMHVGGRVVEVAGIENRRKDERAMFMGAQYGAA